MYKYMIEFSKTGTMCYTSHLDVMKVFKRTFKRANIRLAYSQGFNPHPKMGFAQPLALGYWGLKELMEFETEEEYVPRDIKKKLQQIMPEGLTIIECERLEGLKKTLAAITEAAEYIIAIPLQNPLAMIGEEIRLAYMGQEKIIALKKQKKKKELTQVDIKPMIRQITFTPEAETLFITAVLDSGSASNLSPELVIDSIKMCLDIDTDRSEIEVMRKEIYFLNNFLKNK